MYRGGPEYCDGQLVIPQENSLGSVWISGFDFACNIQKLKERNIRGILSMIDMPFTYPSGFSQIKFKVNDNQQQQMSQCFSQAYNFIESQRKCGNVLIHCAAGRSRSATILISYLMLKYKLSYDQAYYIVKSKRSCVQPNKGFQIQLRKFQNQIKAKAI